MSEGQGWFAPCLAFRMCWLAVARFGFDCKKIIVTGLLIPKSSENRPFFFLLMNLDVFLEAIGFCIRQQFYFSPNQFLVKKNVS